MSDPAHPSQLLKRVDPPLDSNGRPWNSKRASIWGAEISVLRAARFSQSISVGEMAQVHLRLRRRSFHWSAEL